MNIHDTHRRVRLSISLLTLCAALMVGIGLVLTGPAAATLAQSPCGDTEVVVAGDTLIEIAERCNTTVDALLAANPGITETTELEIGRVLAIPPEDPNAPIIYTVQPGDWLSRLALRYNTTVAAILAANPEITNPNLIQVGDQILIPLNGRTLNPSVVIAPQAGVPGSQIQVTASGYPTNTEILIGLGEAEAEPMISERVTTDAQGAATMTFTVPEDAQANQRYTVLAYVPVENGARDTSSEFIVVSGDEAAPDQQPTPEPEPTAEAQPATETQPITQTESITQTQAVTETESITETEAVTETESITETQAVTETELPSTVQISPVTGPPGTALELSAVGLPANSTIYIGAGPTGTGYDIIAAGETNDNGELNRTVRIPELAEAGEEWSIALAPSDSADSFVSNPFLVTPEVEDEENPDLFTSTNIYLIALEDNGSTGMQVGCGDSVVPVQIEIEPTLGVLRAAIQQLLAIDDRFYGEGALYNALYRSDLSIDEISLTDGVATIELSGDVSLGGVCDTPRFKAQLRQTALQFFTVDEVIIYINGELLDDVVQ